MGIPMQRFDQKKIFLNLGGGAARGFAHIGALSALREAQIPFGSLVGVSMGAIVASVYAVNPDVEFTRERVVALTLSKKFQESPIGTWTRRSNESQRSFFERLKNLYTNTNLVRRFFLSPGILEEEQINDVLYPFIPDIAVGTSRIPLYIVAVDLGSGTSKIFSGKDRLRDAVIASASMPMVFPPRQIEGRFYADGGVLDKIGVDAAESLGAEFIIAIDVSDEKLPEPKLRSGLDVMLRTEEIASLYRRQYQLKRADVVIQPIRGNIHWADYSKYREIMDMGYEATRAKIDEIRHKLRLLSLRRFFFMGGFSARRNKLRRLLQGS